jgi:peptidyl-tRNA hydrolase, PTH1 family
MTLELDSNYEVKLIVGLSNPGSKYALTRHNVGVWFINAMLKTSLAELCPVKVAKAKVASWQHESYSCDLMVPTVYMNVNGNEIGRYMRYFNILPENLLVIHDELDFEPGTIRLKLGGGCAGHNGLKSIKENLQSSNFMRFRIGIGRSKYQEEVANYVLSVPPKDEHANIIAAIDLGLSQIPALLAGDLSRVMQELHSET